MMLFRSTYVTVITKNKKGGRISHLFLFISTGFLREINFRKLTELHYKSAANGLAMTMTSTSPLDVIEAGSI